MTASNKSISFQDLESAFKNNNPILELDYGDFHIRVKVYQNGSEVSNTINLDALSNTAKKLADVAKKTFPNNKIPEKFFIHCSSNDPSFSKNTIDCIYKDAQNVEKSRSLANKIIHTNSGQISLSKFFANQFSTVLSNNNSIVHTKIPTKNGLPNLGNTCFANTTFQCLLHAPASFRIKYLGLYEAKDLELTGITKDAFIQKPIKELPQILYQETENLTLLDGESKEHFIERISSYIVDRIVNIYKKEGFTMSRDLFEFHERYSQFVAKYNNLNDNKTVDKDPKIVKESIRNEFGALFDDNFDLVVTQLFNDLSTVTTEYQKIEIQEQNNKTKIRESIIKLLRELYYDYYQDPDSVHECLSRDTKGSLGLFPLLNQLMINKDEFDFMNKQSDASAFLLILFDLLQIDSYPDSFIQTNLLRKYSPMLNGNLSFNDYLKNNPQLKITENHQEIKNSSYSLITSELPLTLQKDNLKQPQLINNCFAPYRHDRDESSNPYKEMIENLQYTTIFKKNSLVVKNNQFPETLLFSHRRFYQDMYGHRKKDKSIISDLDKPVIIYTQQNDEYFKLEYFPKFYLCHFEHGIGGHYIGVELTKDPTNNIMYTTYDDKRATTSDQQPDHLGQSAYVVLLELQNHIPTTKEEFEQNTSKEIINIPHQEMPKNDSKDNSTSSKAGCLIM
jgi:ubiquitin C-terminal hydrolase